MEDEFISKTGTDVTEAFRLYMQPLLGSDVPEAYRLRYNRVAKVLSSTRVQRPRSPCILTIGAV